jgi:cysteinyl-tRNA synthetase
MFVLQSNYQSEGNFTFENLLAAKQRLSKWNDIAALRHQIHDTLTQGNDRDIAPYAARQAIVEALNVNLNTPEALRIVDEAFDTLPLQNIDTIDRHAFVTLLEGVDDLLGLNLCASTPDITDDAKQLILARERAREEKDWPMSDKLRDQLLAEHGLSVRDTPNGTVWTYAS